MSIVSDVQAANKAIIDVLGLKDEGITALDLSFDVAGVPRIIITRFLSDAEAARLVKHAVAQAKAETT